MVSRVYIDYRLLLSIVGLVPQLMLCLYQYLFWKAVQSVAILSCLKITDGSYHLEKASCLENFERLLQKCTGKIIYLVIITV